jgi:hypothetical protein
MNALETRVLDDNVSFLGGAIGFELNKADKRFFEHGVKFEIFVTSLDMSGVFVKVNWHVGFVGYVVL